MCVFLPKYTHQILSSDISHCRKIHLIKFDTPTQPVFDFKTGETISNYHITFDVHAGSQLTNGVRQRRGHTFVYRHKLTDLTHTHTITRMIIEFSRGKQVE